MRVRLFLPEKGLCNRGGLDRQHQTVECCIVVGIQDRGVGTLFWRVVHSNLRDLYPTIGVLVGKS